MRFNPFDLINSDEARRRAEVLKKAHPEMTKRQLCSIITKRKAAWCAGVGTVTALPGSVPGLGTLMALVGGTAFDLMGLLYFMSEMITEMAVVYDRDLRKKGTSREMLWVFMHSIGADAVGKNVSRLAVSQMGRQAFVKLAQELLIALGIRVSQRSVIKIIPFIGAFISGSVNYYFCRRAGRIVADYYETSKPGDWEGVTIDI
ncbi:MAG: hypothetical protein JL50_03300 [Peptococcaceae bacterium BICA1-7]|nr:MAG: hypothetical protein JL50_03300 [Peptococcaceae bacterium BICA1-7]HBV97708.1 hypothetical protein [Desulfotomaculum sp.]